MLHIGRTLSAVAISTFFTLAILTPSLASANNLVATSPSANSTIGVSPNSVSVTGSVLLLDFGNQLTVMDPSGVRVDDGSLSVDGKTLIVGVRDFKLSGQYTVVYELLGVNDVPLQGQFVFRFNSPQISEPSNSPSPAASDLPTIKGDNSKSQFTDKLVIALLICAFLVLIFLSKYARNTFKR